MVGCLADSLATARFRLASKLRLVPRESPRAFAYRCNSPGADRLRLNIHSIPTGAAARAAAAACVIIQKVARRIKSTAGFELRSVASNMGF